MPVRSAACPVARLCLGGFTLSTNVDSLSQRVFECVLGARREITRARSAAFRIPVARFWCMTVATYGSMCIMLPFLAIRFVAIWRIGVVDGRVVVMWFRLLGAFGPLPGVT